MRHRISAKDFSQPHASFGPLQGSVEPVLLHHKRESAFDGVGFCFGTEYGLRAHELHLIELEMCVPSHGMVFHGLSPFDLSVSLHPGC